MGVYARKDSPFYWLLLERKGRRPAREATRILTSTGDTALDTENRRSAQQQYAIRMSALANAEIHARQQQQDGVSPSKTKGHWTYIYFLRQDDAVKIGRATNVLSRMRMLRIGTRHNLELLAAVPAHTSMEAALHKRFKDTRLRGEWFRYDKEMEAFLDLMRRTDLVTALFHHASHTPKAKQAKTRQKTEQNSASL